MLSSFENSIVFEREFIISNLVFVCIEELSQHPATVDLLTFLDGLGSNCQTLKSSGLKTIQKAAHLN